MLFRRPVPNRAGVRLKTGRTNVISLVLSTEHDMMNHTARLISAFAGKLRDTNYHLIVTPYFPDENPMLPVEYIVETGSADAVILNQTEPKDERIAYLMKRNFPFATHGRTDWCHQHAYFDFDNKKYSQYGVEALHARDRKHVLLIAPPPNQTYAKLMIEGAEETSRKMGISVTRLPTATSDDSSARIRAEVSNYIKTTPEVDSIICASTAAAMAAVAASEDEGLKVARDIDIYAKESVSFLSLFRPGIITVREDVTRAGEFLARAAIQAINRPDLPPLQGLDFPSEVEF